MAADKKDIFVVVTANGNVLAFDSFDKADAFVDSLWDDPHNNCDFYRDATIHQVQLQ